MHKKLLIIKDPYNHLTDEELVSRKNATVRNLKAMLEETSKRKIDACCDLAIKQPITAHPANELE